MISTATFVECLDAVAIIVVPQLQFTILCASHQPEDVYKIKVVTMVTFFLCSLNLLPDLSISIALMPSAVA